MSEPKRTKVSRQLREQAEKLESLALEAESRSSFQLNGAEEEELGALVKVLRAELDDLRLANIQARLRDVEDILRSLRDDLSRREAEGRPTRVIQAMIWEAENERGRVMASLTHVVQTPTKYLSFHHSGEPQRFESLPDIHGFFRGLDNSYSAEALELLRGISPNESMMTRMTREPSAERTLWDIDAASPYDNHIDATVRRPQELMFQSRIGSSVEYQLRSASEQLGLPADPEQAYHSWSDFEPDDLSARPAYDPLASQEFRFTPDGLYDEFSEYYEPEVSYTEIYESIESSLEGDPELEGVGEYFESFEDEYEDDFEEEEFDSEEFIDDELAQLEAQIQSEYDELESLEVYEDFDSDELELEDEFEEDFDDDEFVLDSGEESVASDLDSQDEELEALVQELEIDDEDDLELEDDDDDELAELEVEEESGELDLEDDEDEDLDLEDDDDDELAELEVEEESGELDLEDDEDEDLDLEDDDDDELAELEVEEESGELGLEDDDDEDLDLEDDDDDELAELEVEEESGELDFEDDDDDELAELDLEDEEEFEEEIAELDVDEGLSELDEEDSAELELDSEDEFEEELAELEVDDLDDDDLELEDEDDEDSELAELDVEDDDDLDEDLDEDDDELDLDDEDDEDSELAELDVEDDDDLDEDLDEDDDELDLDDEDDSELAELDVEDDDDLDEDLDEDEDEEDSELAELDVEDDEDLDEDDDELDLDDEDEDEEDSELAELDVEDDDDLDEDLDEDDDELDLDDEDDEDSELDVEDDDELDEDLDEDDDELDLDDEDEEDSELAELDVEDDDDLDEDLDEDDDELDLDDEDDDLEDDDFDLDEELAELDLDDDDEDEDLEDEDDFDDLDLEDDDDDDLDLDLDLDLYDEGPEDELEGLPAAELDGAPEAELLGPAGGELLGAPEAVDSAEVLFSGPAQDTTLGDDFFAGPADGPALGDVEFASADESEPEEFDDEEDDDFIEDLEPILDEPEEPALEPPPKEYRSQILEALRKVQNKDEVQARADVLSVLESAVPEELRQVVSERRRLVRLSCEYEVNCYQGNQIFHATIRDISLGGMKIEVSRQLQQGSQLEISNPNPTEGKPDKRVTAQVRWFRVNNSGQAEAGLQFVDPPEVLGRSWVVSLLNKVGMQSQVFNQRKYTRAVADFGVDVVDSNGDVYEGRCVDLGLGGALVDSAPGFEEGDEVLFRCLSFGIHGRLEAKSKVVKIKEMTEDYGTYALEFYDLNAATTKLLGRYVVDLLKLGRTPRKRG